MTLGPQDFGRLHDEAEALRLAGDHEAAIPVYELALELASGAGDLERSARISWGLGLSFRDKHDERATNVLRDAECQAAALGDDVLQAQIGSTLARCLFALGDYGEALTSIERAHAAVRRAEATSVDIPDTLAPALSSLEGDAARYLGDVQRALTAYDAAACGYEVAGDRVSGEAVRRAMEETRSGPAPRDYDRLHREAERLRVAGDHRAAVPLYERAVELARDAADYDRLARVSWGLGLSLLDDDARAMRVLRDAESQAAAIGADALQTEIAKSVANLFASRYSWLDRFLVTRRELSRPDDLTDEVAEVINYALYEMAIVWMLRNGSSVLEHLDVDPSVALSATSTVEEILRFQSENPVIGAVSSPTEVRAALDQLCVVLPANALTRLMAMLLDETPESDNAAG